MLILRGILDLPATETATRLGMTAAAVNSALQRARAALRADRSPTLSPSRIDDVLGRGGIEHAAAHVGGTMGRMGEDMDGDLPGSGLDRSELLDVLHRVMEAAGMDLGADVRDLPARVADLRGLAETRLRRDPWSDVPEPLSLPRPGPGEIPRPGETPGWPQPPTFT